MNKNRTTSLGEKCSSCLRLATGPESLLRGRLRLRPCCRSTHLDCLGINYRDRLLDDSFFHKTLPLSKRIRRHRWFLNEREPDVIQRLDSLLISSTAPPDTATNVLKAPRGIKAKGSLRMPSASMEEGQACQATPQANEKPMEKAIRSLNIQSDSSGDGQV